MLTLAFSKLDWGGLAWVGLVPIFVVTRGRPPRAAKWLWYLFAATWFYASLFWFNTTDYVNPMIWGGVVLMALTLGLYVLLFAWGALWLRRLGAVSLALIPMWWVVAVEYLRTFGELAFPWLFLAHTQHGRLEVIQSAELFGDIAVGLGFTSDTDVGKALRRQEKQMDDGNKHKLIGMHMLEMGLLSTSQLIEILRHYESR